MQPQDIVLYAGLTLTVLNIFDRVSILKEKAKSPYKDHENRITHLEDEVTQLRRYIDNDDKRIKNLEDGGKVLIKSMSALLSHGIDGNNIQEMKIAREELNTDLSSSSTTPVTNPIIPLTGSNMVSRSGNTVSMFLNGLTSSPVSVSPTTVVANIPEGYRPKASAYVFGFVRPTNTGTQEQTIFRIDTNGNIYYNGGSVARNMGYILIVGSYGC